jgi:hypothetical protein
MGALSCLAARAGKKPKRAAPVKNFDPDRAFSKSPAALRFHRDDSHASHPEQANFVKFY